MTSKKISQNKDIHDKVYKSYNLKHAEIYNDYEQSRLIHLIQETVELVKKPAQEVKVLDVGAGTGNLARKYLDLGCKVTASDVSMKSLDLLEQLSGSPKTLSKHLIEGDTLDFPDNTFDIVCTYSVLHHIPDYIKTVREMIRVVQPGGIVYIDHEANSFLYEPDEKLKEYLSKTRQTTWEHLIKLHRTQELYTFDFLKAAFIKTFINKKYQREGDIHVWKDDHIEWDEIFSVANEMGVQIVRDVDYLMYRPKGGLDLYHEYSSQCSNTKYVIFKK